jgi:tryptophanyl-tRNA synthetase
MWILSCTASVGYLSRMTQWKVKSDSPKHAHNSLTDMLVQQKLSVSAASRLDDKGIGSQLKLGLFSYPVLQAADILIHR